MVINNNVWVEGNFLVSFLDSRCSGDNTLHIIVHNFLANDGDPLMILPTEVSALLISYIFKIWARHDGLLPILCCRKNLKAQFKEHEVPMQFILHPVTSNSYK